MSQKQSGLSEEMYHRIYRMVQRNNSAKVIAATLKLPIKTVQNIVERFEETQQPPSTPVPSENRLMQKPAVSSQNSYLDAFLYPKSGYTVLDLSGMVIEKHIPSLEGVIAQIYESNWKNIAIKMTDVYEMDAVGMQKLLEFARIFTGKGYFTALLDPSVYIETFIEKHDLESRIPIYGTESAFGERAAQLRSELRAKGT